MPVAAAYLRLLGCTPSARRPSALVSALEALASEEPYLGLGVMDDVAADLRDRVRERGIEPRRELWPDESNQSFNLGWAAAYGKPLDGGLYALDAATGAILGTWDMGNSVCSSPAIVNGWAYIGGFDQRMYAYSLGTGISLAKHLQLVAIGS